MVSFDRRYRALRRGYSRENVKRDTEAILEQELSDRGRFDPGADGRGVAHLLADQRGAADHLPGQDRLVLELGGDREPGHALELGGLFAELRAAPPAAPPTEGEPIDGAPIEIAQLSTEAPRPWWGQRVGRWLRSMFR